MEEYKKGLDLVLPYIIKCWHNPDFCLNLSIIYEHLEMDDKSIEILERAIASSPLNTLVNDVSSNTWKPHVLLGNIYVKRAEYKKALECWVTAFEFYKSKEILQGLINLSFDLRNIESTKKYLMDMKSLYPNEISYQNNIIEANILFNENKIKESVELFLKVPDGKGYLDRIISSCITRNRLDTVAEIQKYL